MAFYNPDKNTEILGLLQELTQQLGGAIHRPAPPTGSTGQGHPHHHRPKPPPPPPPVAHSQHPNSPAQIQPNVTAPNVHAGPPIPNPQQVASAVKTATSVASTISDAASSLFSDD
jgi:hypothetical protein